LQIILANLKQHFMQSRLYIGSKKRKSHVNRLARLAHRRLPTPSRNVTVHQIRERLSWQSVDGKMAFKRAFQTVLGQFRFGFEQKSGK
jgi:hypothetical protein